MGWTRLRYQDVITTNLFPADEKSPVFLPHELDQQEQDRTQEDKKEERKKSRKKMPNRSSLQIFFAVDRRPSTVRAYDAVTIA